jgi:FAD/FMN-containing dehydrogenase/Fe-S oxidoreductase
MIPRLSEVGAPTDLTRTFVAELIGRGFAGDCDLSEAGRSVLATDNSVYELRPQAVLYPRDTDDLTRIARLAGGDPFRALKLTPRGGGTGTNGQSLTEGVMIDLSRYMNRILEIDVEARFVRVEAGVVKDQLNAALAPHGLFFAPELSTSNRATIGGMVGTDACGQGSCLYGKTRDHVLELTTVLLDGTTWRSSPLGEDALARCRDRTDRVGEIHRVLDDLHRTNRELIERRFPKLNRCLTGYDLAHLRTSDGRFDLNAVLCGSEGTLGLMAEAKLRVLPIPSHVAVVNVRYADFDAALRDAQVLLGLAAASVETIDSLVLGLGRGDPSWSDVAEFFPDDPEGAAQGINLVEFVAHDIDDLERQLARVAVALSGRTGGRRGFTLARGHDAVKRVWAMRKRAAGLLGNLPGERRPMPFVEDTAVPPEKLADYVAEFRALLDGRGLTYGMFGHVDAGVLHVRPALDLRDPADRALIREISNEVEALTARYGGLLWGEHGKGIRSEYVPRVFGPLYPALQVVKAAFDPHGQLNPGKVVALPGAQLMRVDGVPLRGELDGAIPAQAREPYAEGLHCNGNAACFNFDPDDAMCPSWKATRDRRHSPKGRAVLVREWLRRLSALGIVAPEEARRLRRRSAWGDLPARIVNTALRAFGAHDFSHEVKAAMDGCLGCKACAGQCPVKVNIPDIRSKFLELYHGRYLRPPKDVAVTYFEQILPIAARYPRLHNAVVSSRVGTRLVRLGGIVDPPRVAALDLLGECRSIGVGAADANVLAGLDDKERARSVVVVQDAFTSFIEPGVVLDFVRLVRRLGYRPWIAPYRPNGKPLHVIGRLDRFASAAEESAAMLRDMARSGIPLVGVDPSMTLTYRSEYPKALGPTSLPDVLLPQEWLALAVRDRVGRAVTGPAIALLPHCTERTASPSLTRDWVDVFRRFGMELKVLSAGCCGMSGLYGHEAANRGTSERIYDLSWSRLVADGAIAETITATGHSCRSQVMSIDGISIPHPIQVLLRHLDGDAPADTTR